MPAGVELKEQLIAKTGSINDAEFLNQISGLIHPELETAEFYCLNACETYAVNQGIDQLKKGLFSSGNEADNKVDI